MMSERIFVTGIDTEVGKTVVSAILVEALQADYWKPVQAGDLDNTDSHKVKDYVTNSVSEIHPEGFRLNTPASPHVAARLDGVEVSLDKLNPPQVDNTLIIEGAGGLMVPLNDEGEMMVDLLLKTATKVVLVSRNYLGSINHTLSAFEVLKSKGVSVDLLVFSGKQNVETEAIIESYASPVKILRVPLFDKVDSVQIMSFSLKHKDHIFSEFS
ncbi:MAG: dethiobiotin synthetase [Granulosicoccus sp.]|jgi:dethiobiotin synthetase